MRNQYRAGRKGLQAWVSLALYGQVKALAERQGQTMQDFIVEALREKVSRDGSGAVGSRSGLAAVSGGVGSGVVEERSGEGAAGVVADHVPDPLTEQYPLPDSIGGFMVPVRPSLDDVITAMRAESDGDRDPTVAPIGADPWEGIA